MTGVPSKDRDIAMVFQNYALYPNKTVAENMGFALKLRGVSADERRKKVEEAAKILDLTEFLDRKPAKLSGGQRQRVAMGRAIVREPQVFCMDEPLSNLDAKLRVQTRTQIAALQRRLGTTTVYVTHDQVEAMTMGDRVAVLRFGKLQQFASPERALRQAGQRLRRRLHRLARDEPADRADHRRRCARSVTPCWNSSATHLTLSSRGRAQRRSPSASGPSTSRSRLRWRRGRRRPGRGPRQRGLPLHARGSGSGVSSWWRAATRARAASWPTPWSCAESGGAVHLFHPETGERLN